MSLRRSDGVRPGGSRAATARTASPARCRAGAELSRRDANTARHRGHDPFVLGVVGWVDLTDAAWPASLRVSAASSSASAIKFTTSLTRPGFSGPTCSVVSPPWARPASPSTSRPHRASCRRRSNGATASGRPLRARPRRQAAVARRYLARGRTGRRARRPERRCKLSGLFTEASALAPTTSTPYAARARLVRPGALPVRLRLAGLPARDRLRRRARARRAAVAEHEPAEAVLGGNGDPHLRATRWVTSVRFAGSGAATTVHA